VLNGFDLRTLSIYGQFRNKIIFYPVIEGAYVNTKNWYREESNLWAEYGRKSTIRQEVFLIAFGKGVCGQEYVNIRQESYSTVEGEKRSRMRDDVD
jgi:hypothetical protein